MPQQPNYIPAPDADFESWLLNFSTKITAAPTTYGLISGDAVIIAGQYTAWHAAYLAATTPATRTSVTVAAKDVARANAEAIVRPYAQQIVLDVAVTDPNKVALALNVRPGSGTPIPAPADAVVLSFVSATPLVHRLGYANVATPTTKAKGYGSKGVQIFRTIGIAPAVDPDAALYYGTFTKSPFNVAFQSGDSGKVCTYFARFATASGPGGMQQPGPWNAPLSLVIVG